MARPAASVTDGACPHARRPSAAHRAGAAVNGLLGYCRQGFEPELAAELGERAAAAGVAGYARASRDDGHVLFVTADAEDARALCRALPLRGLVFARQKLRLLAELRSLD